MNFKDRLLKAEKREVKKQNKTKMQVSGAGVKTLARLIKSKAK